MALILKAAWQGYRFVFEELTDPRTNTWFLVARPYQGLTLLALYLMFVLKWGPEWMKNRPAFNLDKVLIVYNAIQIVLCAKVFMGALFYAWAFKYRWVCEPVDFSDSEDSLRVASYVHFYFMLKVIDLLDTVFFVLRKKFAQVTFLHVYHHTGMVMLTWGATTYYPGGHGTLVGVINSFVHVVMYSYYLLTVAFPSMRESMWWKKYITQLQILQFFWTVVHMSTPVFKTDCAYPRWASAIFLPQNLFMLILFVDFYIKSYIQPKKAKKISVQNGAQNGVQNNAQNGVQNGAQNGLQNNAQNGAQNSAQNGAQNGTQNGAQNGVKVGVQNANGVKNGHRNGHINGVSDGNSHVKKD